jgi:hypothetical protein
LGAGFLVEYLENVIAFAAALSGYLPHQWLLGHPLTTLYFGLILLSMTTTLASFSIFSRSTTLPTLLAELPPLRLSNQALRLLVLWFSSGCAVAMIALSASGHFGYFIRESYLYTPPLWLDTVRSLINIGLQLILVLLLAAYNDRDRMPVPEWMLVGLWSTAGLASGFKTLVVFPTLFLLVAAWLTNRLSARHWALLASTVVLAYSIVEPLRELRGRTADDNAIEGLHTLVSDGYLTPPEMASVFWKLLSRLDYSTTAVETLDADQYGQVALYRSRLQNAYIYIPVLAFVPRVVWLDKPLADVGRDLSIDLTANSHNSLTPSSVVASYLWLGYGGVILNGVVGAYCWVCAAFLLMKCIQRPLGYLPLLLIAVVLSSPESIKAYKYVAVLRAAVATGLFYCFARPFGLVEWSDARSRSSRMWSSRRGNCSTRPPWL